MKIKPNTLVNNKVLSKGITLVALVVTIVVLIILAVISINIIFGEEGILERANESKEKQKIAEYMDKFALTEANTATNNKGTVTLELFIKQVKEEGIIKEENIEKSEDGSYYTLTTDDGYVFQAIQKAENDVEVIYNGKSENLVRITLSSLTVEEGKEITATVMFGNDIDIEKCKWEYGTGEKLGTDESKYSNTFSRNSETINLTKDKEGEYYLHILVVDKEGNKSEKVSEAVKVYYTAIIELSKEIADLKEIVEATVALGERVDIEKSKWEYSTEEELGTDESKYTNTFSKSQETIELSGDTAGEYYLHILVVDTEGNKIEKISKKINVSSLVQIQLSSVSAPESDPITATVTFGEYVKIEACKWEYGTADKLGIDESKYSNTFTKSPESIELTKDTKGEYYLHILLVDSDGNKTEKISELITVFATVKFKEISAGNKYSLALDEEGYLYAWGDNSYGQLGNGSSGTNVLKPTKIGTRKYKTIAAGSGHSLALDTNGYLYAWGRNYYGQLGNGKSGDTNILTPTKIGTIQYNAITAGYYNSMALDTSGYLYAWGNNNGGQIGNGTSGSGSTYYVVTPTKIGTRKYKAIDISKSTSAFCLALDTTGYLYTWGSNQYAGLGNGSTSGNVTTPTRIGTRTYKTITSGTYGGMALDMSGYLYTWGGNANGECGIGEDDTDVLSPTLIGSTKYKDVQSGGMHGIALDTSGNLYVWGNTTFGQAGYGGEKYVPTKFGDKIFTKTNCGEHFNLALDEKGNLYAWGNNYSGQLGNGSSGTNVSTITKVIVKK